MKKILTLNLLIKLNKKLQSLYKNQIIKMIPYQKYLKELIELFKKYVI